VPAGARIGVAHAAVRSAEVAFVAVSLEKPFYAKEMEILEFLNQPGIGVVQALLLRYRPPNMDVLPLYIVLMLFLPLILQLINWRANLTLAGSVALYTLSWQYDLHRTAYPNGFWSFNPFAWQLLFVFGEGPRLSFPGEKLTAPCEFAREYAANARSR
jgi:hypothetical protein